MFPGSPLSVLRPPPFLILLFTRWVPGSFSTNGRKTKEVLSIWRSKKGCFQCSFEPNLGHFTSKYQLVCMNIHRCSWNVVHEKERLNGPHHLLSSPNVRGQPFPEPFRGFRLWCGHLWFELVVDPNLPGVQRYLRPGVLP